MTMRPSAAGQLPPGSSSGERRSPRKGKRRVHASARSGPRREGTEGGENDPRPVLFLSPAGVSDEEDAESEMFDEDGLSLSTEDLLSFSHQVAKGMEFLAAKNVSGDHHGHSGGLTRLQYSLKRKLKATLL